MTTPFAEQKAVSRSNGNAYLAQWQRDASSVSDPELRALAEQRRDQIARSSEEMRSKVTLAAGSFAAFLRDMAGAKTMSPHVR